MIFNLDKSAGNPVGIVVLSVRVDAHNSSELQKAFVHWMQYTSSFVFDCSGLDFIDSSGLGTIVSCLRKALEKNGDLKLAALNQKVALVFELTKAKKLFSIFESAEEAIKSFASPMTA